MYTYRIIKENLVNGTRGKRTRTITRYKPLEIGGLYMHLGAGYPGAYRVLELISYEPEEEETEEETYDNINADKGYTCKVS